MLQFNFLLHDCKSWVLLWLCCPSGNGDDIWKIAYVTLKVTEKFRYFLQGIRGSSNSTGAILIDDIALTEIVCPSAVWQIRNFTALLATTPTGTPVRSQCFFNSEGYSFGVSVYPNGKQEAYSDYIGMTLHLCSGENDAVMQWPAQNRQATIVAMDQDPDVKLRMSSTRSFTTGRLKSWGYKSHDVLRKMKSLHGTIFESCSLCTNNLYITLQI